MGSKLYCLAKRCFGLPFLYSLPWCWNLIEVISMVDDSDSPILLLCLQGLICRMIRPGIEVNMFRIFRSTQCMVSCFAFSSMFLGFLEELGNHGNIISHFNYIFWNPPLQWCKHRLLNIWSSLSYLQVNQNASFVASLLYINSSRVLALCWLIHSACCPFFALCHATWEEQCICQDSCSFPIFSVRTIWWLKFWNLKVKL